MIFITNAGTGYITAVADTWLTSNTTGGTTLAQSYLPTMGTITTACAFTQNVVTQLAQQYAAQARAMGQTMYQAQSRPTAEELAAAQERHLERRRVVEAVRDKARALLLSHLTPEQRATFEKNNWFVVEGGATKHKYRINTTGGVAGNIAVLDRSGRAVATLCAHCSHDIPAPDQWLTQKLMLEHDEAEFLRVANRR